MFVCWILCRTGESEQLNERTGPKNLHIFARPEAFPALSEDRELQARPRHSRHTNVLHGGHEKSRARCADVQMPHETFGFGMIWISSSKLLLRNMKFCAGKATLLDKGQREPGWPWPFLGRSDFLCLGAGLNTAITAVDYVSRTRVADTARLGTHA